MGDDWTTKYEYKNYATTIVFEDDDSSVDVAELKKFFQEQQEKIFKSSADMRPMNVWSTHYLNPLTADEKANLTKHEQQKMEQWVRAANELKAKNNE